MHFMKGIVATADKSEIVYDEHSEKYERWCALFGTIIMNTVHSLPECHDSDGRVRRAHFYNFPQSCSR